MKIKSLKDMKILALIPARSGSKSIPDKNIRDLHGHPLMAYSIGIALLSRYINRIIVTTDSEDYAVVARSYGAETPFIRPKRYARDISGDIDYHKHAIDWLKRNEGYEPDLIVVLRPTAPARDPQVLDQAIEMAIKNPRATAVRTVHLVERTAYKMLRIKRGYAAFFGVEDYKNKKVKESMNISRQFLPKTYEINGYIDVARPSVLKKGMVYGFKVLPLIVPKTADIDELSDFHFAEKILDKKLVTSLNEIKGA